MVTLLYKQRGSKNDPSNYRPVSLLHAVGKLLDSIVTDRLLHFLTKNNLLSVHQHGFLPRRSTVTQLTYVVEKWMRAMDSKECNMAVFMDFMKAFDRVWRVGLVHKLLRSEFLVMLLHGLQAICLVDRSAFVLGPTSLVPTKSQPEFLKDLTWAQFCS